MFEELATSVITYIPKRFRYYALKKCDFISISMTI